MRIGLLSNLSFQKYDASSQRDVVAKHVPGYLQVQYYDLTSEDNLISINGTIIGSSNANLILQCQQLTSMYRQKKVVWIDVSDQYQNRLDLCKITKLTGPTIDSRMGPLVATFSLQAISLPPWGTTHANPFNATGIVFRDLDGRVSGNAVNPLNGNYNFTPSPAGGPFTSFSWEFIVDNQSPFTNATSYEWALGNNLGSGTGSVSSPLAVSGVGSDSLMTVNLDTANYPNSGYSASIVGQKTTPAASTYYDLEYDFGSPGINISSYERLRLWFRCDQSGQTTYHVLIRDTSGNYRNWAFSLQAGSTWQQVLVNIAAYSNQSAPAPNLSAIQYIGVEVETASGPPTEITVWLADIRTEIGYANHCEDTSGWTPADGTGQTFSNDYQIFKNSYYASPATLPSNATMETSALSALKMAGTTSSASLGAVYTLPLGPWNVSSYDFIVFYFRSDFAGATTGALNFYLETTQGSVFFEWTYNSLNANEWYRLVVPLGNPTSTTGSPNLDSIVTAQFSCRNCNSGTGNLWIDEIAFDVGNPVVLEMHVPDNISGGVTDTTAGAQLFCWQSGYFLFQQWNDWDPASSSGEGQNVYGATFPYYLDGSSAQSIYGQGNSSGNYAIGPIGSVNPNPHNSWTGSPAAPEITYSTTYGCLIRLATVIKLPPATSDSGSGNLPSDDLSGFQALNKVRLKVLIYIVNEDTSYSGF